MYFEYPYLLWLLIVPALLAVKYVYDELRDRRPHFRVSVRAPWMAGGSTVLDKVRHIPFIFRIAALCLIIVALARPRSSTKVEKIDTEGIDIAIAMDVSTRSSFWLISAATSSESLTLPELIAMN